MHNKKIEMELEYEMLLEAIRFSIEKFRSDNYKMTSMGSKRSMIGEYIDRWISAMFENIFFDYILMKHGKNYRTFKDLFLYSVTEDKEKVQKNAPDVLGLISRETENIIAIFSKFKKNQWVKIDKAPQIEVKTFKKDQSLYTSRVNQVTDNKYYCFFSWNLDPEYLEAFMKDEVFEELKSWNMENFEHFVLNDEAKALSLPHIVLDRIDNFGKLSLKGILTGKELKNRSYLANGKPYYIDYIKQVDKVHHQSKSIENSLNIERGLSRIDLSFAENKHSDNKKSIKYIAPFVFATSHFTLKVYYHFKSSTYFLSNKEIILNNKRITKNKLYKIKWKLFDRNKKEGEYIFTKDDMGMLTEKIDKTKKLLDHLDSSITNKTGLI